MTLSIKFSMKQPRYIAELMVQGICAIRYEHISAREAYAYVEQAKLGREVRLFISENDGFRKGRPVTLKELTEVVAGAGAKKEVSA